MTQDSLYQQLLGAEFALLPAALRDFHALAGEHVLHGWVKVDAPTTRAAKCLAWCLGAPLTASEGAIRFELKADGCAEAWTRHFPGRTMRSRLGLDGDRIVERLGAARLDMALDASADKLEMRLVRLRFLGLPCPRPLLPRIVAVETASPGRLHFRVRAALPLLGLVASYHGHLELPEGEPA